MLVKIGIALLVIGGLLSGVLYDYPDVAEYTAFFAFAGLIMLVVAFYKKIDPEKSGSIYSAPPERQLKYSPEQQAQELEKHKAYIRTVIDYYLNPPESMRNERDLAWREDDLINACFGSLLIYEDKGSAEMLRNIAGSNDMGYVGTDYPDCGGTVSWVMSSSKAMELYEQRHSSELYIFRQYKD